LFDGWLVGWLVGWDINVPFQYKNGLYQEQNCLMSDDELVNFDIRYAVWYDRMMSPLGSNTFHIGVDGMGQLDALWSVTPACIFKAVKSRYDISQV